MIKIKNKRLKIIIAIILIIFASSYYVSNSGYYEYHLQERTVLTSKKIKEFEEDIKNNENIDVKDYLSNNDYDYTNRFTNLVYGVSDGGSKITRKILKRLFKKLRYLVED